MDATVPWIWFSDEQAKRYTDLPPSDPPGESHPDAAQEALRQVACDQTGMLVLYGFRPEAVAILAGDRLFAQRDLVWIVRPGQLRQLAEAVQACDGLGKTLTVGACRQVSDLPAMLERLPFICWSLAFLGDDRRDLEQIQYYRMQRLNTGYHVIVRTMVDVAHLRTRVHRLHEAVPMQRWQGAYADRAALCLAAGPSLDRHLDFVRRHQDTCVVISADILAARMAEAGVRVDFIVNVDSHDLLAERLHPTGDPETALVMPITGHRAIDDRFPLRSYVGGDALGDSLLVGAATYSHGTNVGCATVGWAIFLGCRELVLVGHDLAFTPQAFYSTLVHGHEGLAARNRLHAQELERIPGNDGIEVETDRNFRLGVRDLGVILDVYGEDGVVAYNLNIGHRLGALIPNTRALPEGWTPPGTGPKIRPGALASDGVRQATAPLPEGGYDTLLHDQISRYRTRWDELATGNPDPLGPFVTLIGEAELATAHQQLLPFLAGHVGQLLRLGSLPDTESTGWATAATAAHMPLVLAAAERVYCETLSAGRYIEPPAHRHYDERQLGFFTELRTQVPVITPGSLDEVVLPIIWRDWTALVAACPDVGLPPPWSYLDGLRSCVAMQGRTPPAFLLQTLVAARLAASAGLSYVIDLAQAHGLLDAELHSPLEAVAGTPCLAALRALLQLPTATTGQVELTRQAAAWPACNLHLIRVLLSGSLRSGPGPALLAQVVTEDRLRLDNPAAALVLELHPHIPAACDLVDHAQVTLGEACVVAMSRRMIEIGDHQGALRELRRLSPLGRHAIDGFILAAECLVTLNDFAGIDALIQALPGGRVRSEALLGFLTRRLGPAKAIRALVDHPIRPVAARVLASSLSAAIEQRNPHPDAGWLDVLARLAEESVAACRTGDPERPELERTLAAIRETRAVVHKNTGQ